MSQTLNLAAESAVEQLHDLGVARWPKSSYH